MAGDAGIELMAIAAWPFVARRRAIPQDSRRGCVRERSSNQATFGDIAQIGIVRQFRFFLGVEVIEIAEEFVEPVHGRQIFVAIAQMVLAELTGGVAERLRQFGDGRIFRVKSDRCAGMPTLVKPVRIGL